MEFQSFDICMPWLEAYVYGAEPTHRAHVLAFYDNAGRLVALAPLAQKITRLTTMAEWIGEPLVQYGDILMDPDCDRKALSLALTQALGDCAIDGLVLRNVRADARIGEVLDLAPTQLGAAREAALADLTAYETSDDYFATFSKRSRQNRRKKRNALAKKGELSFESVEAGPRAEELCVLALAWKLEWLADRGLSSRAFMDARALETVKAVCKRQSEHNPLRLFVQSIDGKPVAIELGFVGSEGNAAFMGTYDPAYEALSPGKVQMESTIMHGFEEGWSAYDMLAPMSAYKESWSNRTVGVADYMIPTSLVGRLYRDVYQRSLRPAAKALWHAMPAKLRGIALRQGGLASL